MPSTSAPFGLRPARHNSGGIIRPKALWLNKAQADALASMAENQPIQLTSAGVLAPVTATNQPILGVFAWANWQDYATGRPVINNQWVTGTTVQNNGGQSAQLFYYDDPFIVYEIQGNAALAITSLGEEANLANFTDVSLGISRCTLSSSSASASQAQLRIIGLGREVDNYWTDSYPIVEVIISAGQYLADKAGV